MTTPPSDDLILEYLTGKLSGEAAVEARRYLDTTPERRGVAAALRQVMRAEVLEGGAPDAHRSLQKVLARLPQERQANRQNRVGIRTVALAGRARPAGWGMRMLRGGLGIAAAVLVVGVIMRTWPVGGQRTSQMLTYSTANGERATITLPDGGTVALNVASRLDVPMDYMAGNRTLRLVGEGLFTVSHHAGTPLSVVMGTTTARVLGTRFVARRYAEDTAAMVVVQDGKVAVGTTVVTANQLIVVGPMGVSQIRRADPSQFTFATGILTIDGLPLSAAIVELNRWFDADIRLGDPTLSTQFVKGNFAVGSLGSLAEILELTFDVRVVRDGRVLTLYPKR